MNSLVLDIETHDVIQCVNIIQNNTTQLAGNNIDIPSLSLFPAWPYYGSINAIIEEMKNGLSS